MILVHQVKNIKTDNVIAVELVNLLIDKKCIQPDPSYLMQTQVHRAYSYREGKDVIDPDPVSIIIAALIDDNITIQSIMDDVLFNQHILPVEYIQMEYTQNSSYAFEYYIIRMKYSEITIRIYERKLYYEQYLASNRKASAETNTSQKEG